MPDHDKEAGAYDDTRGGEPRAATSWPPCSVRSPRTPAGPGRGLRHRDRPRRLAVARPATRVTGADLTYGMARMAAVRLPGVVVVADGRALPFPVRAGVTE